MSLPNLLTEPAQRPPFYRSISSRSQLSVNSSRSSKVLSFGRTFSYQKDKPRLYLALFSRGGTTGGTYGSQLSCDSYHWALVIGSQSPLRSEAGTAFHIVHGTSDSEGTHFFYEETDLRENPYLARNFLARIALAKVVDERRVVALFRTLASSVSAHLNPTHVPPHATNHDATSFSCLSWVKAAWAAVSEDSQRPLKSYFGPEDWPQFENEARKYVKRKRRQGRYNPNTEPGGVTWDPAEVPTWNYWENRETTD